MRVRSLKVAAVAVAVFLSGCGDDDSDAFDDVAADDAAGDAAADEGSSGDTAGDAAADGGADDGAAAGDDDGSGDAAPAGDGGAGDAGGAAPGTGTVTVGDQSYDLEVDSCFTFAGALGASAIGADQPDNVIFDVSLSPDDWRDRPANEGWTSNGSVVVEIQEPYRQWESGGDALEFFAFPDGFGPEDFVITSYDISDDGRSAVGEATFLDLEALLFGTPIEPTPGSFSITCPPE